MSAFTHIKDSHVQVQTDTFVSEQACTDSVPLSFLLLAVASFQFSR